MDAFRARMSRLPLLCLFLFAFVFWGGLMLTFDRLTHPTHPFALSAATWAIAGAVFAGILTAVAWRARRREASADLEASVTRAVRSGDLPVDARSDEWVPVLARRRAIASSTLRWSPVLFGFLAAVSVLLAVTVHGGQQVVEMVVAPVFVIGGITSFLTNRRAVRSIDELLRTLRLDRDR